MATTKKDIDAMAGELEAVVRKYAQGKQFPMAVTVGCLEVVKAETIEMYIMEHGERL